MTAVYKREIRSYFSSPLGYAFLAALIFFSGFYFYDMFLSGELSKIVIENSNAKTDKELVIFRDSYGRSILPLMVDDYAKITIIDIRYQVPQILFAGVNFENADVLFLYSTLILNNSYELK